MCSAKSPLSKSLIICTTGSASVLDLVLHHLFVVTDFDACPGSSGVAAPLAHHTLCSLLGAVLQRIPGVFSVGSSSSASCNHLFEGWSLLECLLPASSLVVWEPAHARLLARDVTIPYRLPPSQHKPDDSYELFLIREEYEKRKQKLIEELHQLDHWRFMAEVNVIIGKEKEKLLSERTVETSSVRNITHNKPVLSQQAPVAPGHLPALQTPFRGLTQTECRVPQPRPVSYSDALKQQIAEKQLRKEREKQEQELYNSKIEAESREYSYWGRGGGGAPLRDNSGNLITDLKAHLRNNEARESGPRAERKPASPKTGCCLQVFLPHPLPPGLCTLEIEEKKRRKAEEREKRRMEDEMEERRLAQQRESMRKDYEQEQEKKRQREKEYEDARRKQMEERERMREDEKRQIAVEPEAVHRKPERTPEKVQEVKETYSRPPPRSPPVPALRNKLRGTENAHANLHSNTTVGQICEEEKAKMTRAFSQLRGELQSRQRRLQREMVWPRS
ncbi:hypothetical protein DNTS_013846 [Danionella cerebrum]|uniref:CCDC66 domain-containing protein n=1 Tax=Danionella cerebrum TaxID=2873325 RepID=A0A553P5I4_9TELE|nr:hypothetical protein DNTS_013846 [Danionella translucida]